MRRAGVELVEPFRYFGFPCLLRASVGRSIQAREEVMRECGALALGKLERDVQGTLQGS
ncbi:MAG: hypothetical protein WBW93_04805 [Steroidobacteraceae bacterium]